MGHRGLGGAPERIRTPDPQIRSLVLYPAELPAQKAQKPQVSRGWADQGRAITGTLKTSLRNTLGD